MSDKTHSAKALMSITQKSINRTGENNPMRTGDNYPMYGKTHLAETKEKMSAIQGTVILFMILKVY